SRIPKRIFAEGYDRITRRYLALVKSMDPTVRQKYLAVLDAALTDRARVLELGCGAGVPITEHLARRYRVIGLDLSPGQLDIARRCVAAAEFVRGDMAALAFAGASFDAVVAFYAIIHVPRYEHSQVLAEACRVLRPGGLLVMTAGAGDSADMIEEDWLGAPMFFSHFDGQTTERLVSRAGFEIIESRDERELEYGVPVWFRWIVARKPRQP
ncbi:MAG: class I SAM-dependent methyltransferase, partial [Anaerolineae bacterium]